MQFRIRTVAGAVLLEIPGEFWAAHSSILAAMGIADRGPVESEQRAQEISARAAKSADKLAEKAKRR